MKRLEDNGRGVYGEILGAGRRGTHCFVLRHSMQSSVEL